MYFGTVQSTLDIRGMSRTAENHGDLAAAAAVDVGVTASCLAFYIRDMRGLS